MKQTQFPILYSRTSNGSIHTWQIHVGADGYWTESGMLGGQITVSEPTLVTEKNIGRANQKSISEQAYLEAEAKYKKKLKDKYFEKIEDVDGFKYVKPMLAYPLDKVTKGLQLPALVQMKFNGMRCVITRHGPFSRKGEKIMTIPHIVKSLEGFFEENPEAVLDGELANLELRERLNETMKLVRATVNITQELLEKSRELISLFVYDGWGFNDTTQETPYSIRKFHIDNIVNTYNQYLRPVETFLCRTEKEVYNKYEEFIADSHEGAIVRYADNKYEGKRSQRLIKLKPTDSKEFLIIGVEEGEGNRSKMAGKMVMKMPDGRTFKANMKGNEEQFAEVLRNKQNYIGKWATIDFNGYTGKLTDIVNGQEETFKTGKPNYAQFSCENWMNDKSKKGI